MTTAIRSTIRKMSRQDLITALRQWEAFSGRSTPQKRSSIKRLREAIQFMEIAIFNEEAYGVYSQRGLEGFIMHSTLSPSLARSLGGQITIDEVATAPWNDLYEPERLFGVGTRLIEDFIDRAKKVKGIREITVWAISPVSRKILKRYGFKFKGRIGTRAMPNPWGYRHGDIGAYSGGSPREAAVAWRALEYEYKELGNRHIKTDLADFLKLPRRTPWATLLAEFRRRYGDIRGVWVTRSKKFGKRFYGEYGPTERVWFEEDDVISDIGPEGTYVIDTRDPSLLDTGYRDSSGEWRYYDDATMGERLRRYERGKHHNPTLAIPIRSKKQLDHLFNAQSELSKAGVTFDSGTQVVPRKERHWELDWSLKGAKIGGRYMNTNNPRYTRYKTINKNGPAARLMRKTHAHRNPFTEAIVTGAGIAVGFKLINYLNEQLGKMVKQSRKRKK